MLFCSVSASTRQRASIHNHDTGVFLVTMLYYASCTHIITCKLCIRLCVFVMCVCGRARCAHLWPGYIDGRCCSLWRRSVLWLVSVGYAAALRACSSPNILFTPCAQLVYTEGCVVECALSCARAPVRIRFMLSRTHTSARAQYTIAIIRRTYATLWGASAAPIEQRRSRRNTHTLTHAKTLQQPIRGRDRTGAVLVICDGFLPPWNRYNRRRPSFIPPKKIPDCGCPLQAPTSAGRRFTVPIRVWHMLVRCAAYAVYTNLPQKSDGAVRRCNLSMRPKFFVSLFHFTASHRGLRMHARCFRIVRSHSHDVRIVLQRHANGVYN